MSFIEFLSTHNTSGAGLLEALFEGEVEPDITVLFTDQNGGPLPAQRPLDAEKLRTRARYVAYVGEQDFGCDLLLDSQARLRASGDACQAGDRS